LKEEGTETEGRMHRGREAERDREAEGTELEGRELERQKVQSQIHDF